MVQKDLVKDVGLVEKNIGHMDTMTLIILERYKISI